MIFVNTNILNMFITHTINSTIVLCPQGFIISVKPCGTGTNKYKLTESICRRHSVYYCFMTRILFESYSWRFNVIVFVSSVLYYQYEDETDILWKIYFLLFIPTMKLILHILFKNTFFQSQLVMTQDLTFLFYFRSFMLCYTYKNTIM